LLTYRKYMLNQTEAGLMLQMANQGGIYSFAQGVKGTKLGEDGYTPEFMKSSCYHHHTLYLTSRESIERLIPLFEQARNAARKRAALPRKKEEAVRLEVVSA
jgi:hypothetical protein